MLKGAGLRGIDVAARLGIDDSSLSLKLNGKRPWRPEELAQVRDILAGVGRPVSMDDFFTSNEAA